MSATIESITQPLLNLPCWNVTWERHTNLGLHFGQPSLHIQEPHARNIRSAASQTTPTYRRVTVRGAWFLWIFYAYWNVVLPERTAITGRTRYRAMHQELMRLDGQKLSRIEVLPATGATRMTFDLGAELRIRRMDRTAEADMWSLYTPDSSVLSVRGDGMMSYQKDTEPELWKPIQC